MTTFQQVLEAARNLSAEDRTRLVELLWEESTPEQWPLPSEAWIKEVNRRSEAFDRGEMTAAPWSEVRSRARREAGLDG